MLGWLHREHLWWDAYLSSTQSAPTLQKGLLEMNACTAGRQAGSEAADEDEVFGLRPKLSHPPCYIYAFLTPLRFPQPSHPDPKTGALSAGSHMPSKNHQRHL